MTIADLPKPKSAEEARQQAIEWQLQFGEQNYSWQEVADWGGYFEKLAAEFGLTDEFKENGII